MNKVDSRLRVIISMVIFGTIGILRRYIMLPSAFLAFSRGVIGSVFLIVLSFFSKEKNDKKISRQNFLLLMISGMLIGLNWVFLFEAYNYTSIAIATMCYYMAPVIVMVISACVFKERYSMLKIVCAACSVVGMALVSGFLKEGFELGLGVIYGLVAASMYGTVIVLNRHISGVDGRVRTIYQLSFAALAVIPYILLKETVVITGYNDIVFTLIAGVIHTGVAYALYFGAISELETVTVALLSYVDPIVAVILSFTLLGESFDLNTLIGTAMVIVSMMISEMKDR